jgi:hypothetical protein
MILFSKCIFDRKERSSMYHHTLFRAGFLGLLSILALSQTSFADEQIQQQPTEPAAVTTTTQVTPEHVPNNSNQEYYAPSYNMMSVATPAALSAKDFITTTQEILETRGQYQVVQLTLKNSQSNHLEVIHGEVLNGVDEAIVAQEQLQKSNTRKKVAGGLLRGLSSVPFVGRFGYASAGAYHAAAVGSQVAHTAAGAIESSQGGEANITGAYVKQFSAVMVMPNSTHTFKTLIPKGQTPQVKLVFKNLESNQIFDFQN